MATHALIQTDSTNTLAALPAGRGGVRKTLEVMQRAALQAAVTPQVRGLALGIVAPLAGKDYAAEAAAVQDWVRQNIRYTRDVRGVEVLQTPAKTLAVGQGDCDDHSTLVAALLTSLGHQARLVAVGFAPGRWAHVLCEVLINGQWLTVETTEPWPLGHRLPRVAERMVAPVADGAEIAGWFKRLRKAVVKRANPLNPIGSIKTLIQDGKDRLKYIPAAASGFVSGGVVGAVVSVAMAETKDQIARGQQTKLNRELKAATAAEMDAAGKELADYAQDASAAPKYAARLKAAKDPNAEASAILAEINAQRSAPVGRDSSRQDSAPALQLVPPTQVVAVQPDPNAVIAVQASNTALQPIAPQLVASVEPASQPSLIDTVKPYALPIGVGLGVFALAAALRSRA